LKSENVLLTAHTEVKLYDFGLAKTKKNISGTNLYMTHPRIFATLPWMAPELFLPGPEYGKKSDISAFRMILWEIASRSKPYKDHANPSSIMMLVLLRDGRETIPEDSPEEFSVLIKQCWLKDPLERPSTIEILK